MLLAVGHRILSLHIKSTSYHLKTHLYKNRAISANLDEKNEYYVTVRGGEEQGFFPCRGTMLTGMAFGLLTFFRRPRRRIKLLQP